MCLDNWLRFCHIHVFLYLLGLEPGWSFVRHSQVPPLPSAAPPMGTLHPPLLSRRYVSLQGLLWKSCMAECGGSHPESKQGWRRWGHGGTSPWKGGDGKRWGHGGTITEKGASEVTKGQSFSWITGLCLPPPQNQDGQTSPSGYQEEAEGSLLSQSQSPCGSVSSGIPDYIILVTRDSLPL